MLSFLYSASNTMLSYSPLIGLAEGGLAYKDKHYLGIALGGAVTVLGLWANRRAVAKDVGEVVGDAIAGSTRSFTGDIAGAAAGAYAGPAGGIEGLNETFRLFAKGATLWSTLLLAVRLADLYIPEKYITPPPVASAKVGDKSHRAMELAAPLSVVYAKIKHWLQNEPRIRVHIDSPEYLYFSCVTAVAGLPQHMSIRLSTYDGRTRVDGRAELRVFGMKIADDARMVQQFFGYLEDQRYAIEDLAARSG